MSAERGVQINKLMQALLKTGRKDSAADLVRALVETNPGSRLSKNVVKALDLTKATPKGEPHAIHGTDSATVLSVNFNRQPNNVPARECNT